MLALLGLAGSFGLPRYAVSIASLCFAWNITFPLLLASLAELDSAGRWVVIANVTAFVGTAVGPAFLGSLLTGGYEVVGSFGAVLMFLCWLALLAGARLRPA